MLGTRTSAVDKLDPAQRASLEETAVAINELFLAGDYEFRLKSPEKLTVLRGGAYSKKPYIGDEKFKGQRAYLGKSGKIILVFSDLGESGVMMEMPLNDSLTRLGGMGDFSKKLQQHREDKTMGAARAEAKEIEHLAHVEAASARHLENPAYGSW